MAPESPPEGLCAAAGDLWGSVLATYQLDASELAALAAACRTLTELERIEAELAEADTMIVEGSTGQPVAHPLLEEARRHRKVLADQLRAVALPDDEHRSGVERSHAARQLARARWGNRGA